MDNMCDVRSQKLSQIRSVWSQILSLLARILGLIRDLRSDSDIDYAYSQLMQDISNAMRLITEQMYKLSCDSGASPSDMLGTLTDPLAQELTLEHGEQLFIDPAESERGTGGNHQDKPSF